MGVIPSGISVQEIYRRYRENQIVVNRKYQRNWTSSNPHPAHTPAAHPRCRGIYSHIMK